MARIPPAEERKRIFIGSMKDHMARMGYRQADVADRMGMPIGTFKYRLREPERFQITELRILFKVLKYPEEEKMQLLSKIM